MSALRHLPNLICLARIALIWPILAALAARHYGFAALCFAIAGVSDLLDGFLAKRCGWTSELGKWLDPVADKFLLVTVFVAAAWAGLVPRWLTAVVVARDVMIALGALTYLAWLGPLEGRPTLASKLNTLVQLAYLLGILTYKASGFPPVSLLALGAMVTLVTAVMSGAGYVIEYSGRAARAPA
ncbi:MAG TPA: CDP-alcohol phosphatidyltransferase family protein [Steroidobacteraceae bacterium]|nr:CDP-alcohol phosphatidyltransferase family protein [Steroidobacteraceae bacterium]